MNVTCECGPDVHAARRRRAAQATQGMTVSLSAAVWVRCAPAVSFDRFARSRRFPLAHRQNEKTAALFLAPLSSLLLFPLQKLTAPSASSQPRALVRGVLLSTQPPLKITNTLYLPLIHGRTPPRVPSPRWRVQMQARYSRPAHCQGHRRRPGAKLGPRRP